jgi:hypothetical protein
LPDITDINGVALSSITDINGVAKANITDINGISIAAASTGIISANLVQHLDAGDSSSYSGSGSTWSDLTSNGVDGTLINSPTYSTIEGGGSFFFDGTSEYVKFPYDDSTPIRIGEDSGEVDLIQTSGGSRTYGDVGTDGGITIYAWAKLSSSGHHAVWCNNTAISASGNNTAYKFYQGIELIYLSDGRVLCYCFGGGNQNNGNQRIDLRTTAAFHTSTVGVSVGNWVNICVIMEDDADIAGPSGSGRSFTGSIYINGVKATGSELQNDRRGTGQGLGYRMKGNSSQTDKYDGGIGLRRNSFDAGYSSEIAIYNDVLTDAEVLSNFNATKSRYGY